MRVPFSVASAELVEESGCIYLQKMFYANLLGGNCIGCASENSDDLVSSCYSRGAATGSHRTTGPRAAKKTAIGKGKALEGGLGRAFCRRGRC